MLLESGRRALQIDAGGAPFGGGSFDIGARVLAPALWARGIRALDTLLRHARRSRSHRRRARRGRRLQTACASGRASSCRGTCRLPALANARRTRSPRRSPPAGETFQRRRSHARAAPARAGLGAAARTQRRLGRSRSACGDVALLLTGDIGDEIERAIVPQLTPAHTRILKVAHHGSRTSSSPRAARALAAADRAHQRRPGQHVRAPNAGGPRAPRIHRRHRFYARIGTVRSPSTRTAQRTQCRPVTSTARR